MGEILGTGGEVFADLVAATFTERCRGELGDLRSTLRELCRRLGVEPTSPAVEAAAAFRMDAQARLLQLRADAVTVVGRFRRHGWLTGLLPRDGPTTGGVRSDLAAKPAGGGVQ